MNMVVIVMINQGKSGGGGGHKGRWDPTDDGSEAQAVDGIADKGDPNYDSEDDDHDNNYVLVHSSSARFVNVFALVMRYQ